MSLETTLKKLRTNRNMSQEQFAELLSVSKQSVQKWEKGLSVPELDKLVRISKHFDISLDSLVFDRDTRFIEGMSFCKKNSAKI